jgi:hypothetical protein
MQVKTRVLADIGTIIVAGAPSIVGIASPVFAAGPGPDCPTTNTPVAGSGGDCEIAATIQGERGAGHRDRFTNFGQSSTANICATTPGGADDI